MESAAFWDKVAKKYAARPVDDETAYQNKLAITQSFFNAEMEVFEFGCGTGSTVLVHAPKVKHYVATDISPKMIEIAKSKLVDSSINNLEFKVATVADSVNHSKQYDAVLGLNVLHLLKDYQAVIQSVYELLKPGGIFVTSTGCLSEGMSYMRFVIPMMKFFRVAPHVEFFSRQTLLKAMTSIGFELEHQWVPPKSKIGYFLIVRKPN